MTDDWLLIIDDWWLMTDDWLLIIDDWLLIIRKLIKLCKFLITDSSYVQPSFSVVEVVDGAGIGRETYTYLI